MTTSEIISLIATIFAALSAIASFLVCFLTYKNSRPNIEFKISRENGHLIYTSYKDISFALIAFDMYNYSAVPGVIDNICLIYNGNKYYAETISSKFELEGLKLNVSTPGNNRHNDEKLRFKCPIRVDGFSSSFGFIYFPSFPEVMISGFIGDVTFRTLNRKRKFKVKNLRFSRIEIRGVK